MNAKRYLNQLDQLSGMILRTKELIEELRATKRSAGAIRYDRPRVQTSPADSMARYAARLDELERKELKLLAEYHAKFILIQDQISGIGNDLYAKVLSLRYLDRMRLFEIADELGYTESYIRNVHGQALKAFALKYLEC